MAEIESSILDAHWLDSEFQPEWPPKDGLDTMRHKRASTGFRGCARGEPRSRIK